MIVYSNIILRHHHVYDQYYHPSKLTTLQHQTKYPQHHAGVVSVRKAQDHQFAKASINLLTAYLENWVLKIYANIIEMQ